MCHVRGNCTIGQEEMQIKLFDEWYNDFNSMEIVQESVTPAIRTEGNRTLAQDTLRILEQGAYTNGHGIEIRIEGAQKAAQQGTLLYTPEQGGKLLAAQAEHTVGNYPQITITEEPTVDAARRLVCVEDQDDLFVLNFASARKPGGGFLNGAGAQEETIAGASGLYPILQAQPDYYRAGKSGSGIYTDSAIYSPHVPWFRSHDGALLDNFFTASVISMSAPNVGSYRDKAKIEDAIRRRVGIMLSIAVEHGHRSLLLGAWGCGVFKNDPTVVADSFGTWLESERFRGSFDNVTFAIVDTSQDQRILNTFQKRLEK